MRKLPYCLLAVTFVFFATFLQAQTSFVNNPKKKSDNISDNTTLHRCGTTLAYEQLFKQNPAFKKQFEENSKRINELASQRRAASRGASFTLKDTIAVVVHVIGSSTLQSQVTNAVIQSQIDTLNVDFNGLNADSTRIPAAFKPLYGKMGITFKLAQTAPNGTSTDGIVRRTNNISFSSTTYDNAKRTATGGLDAWDATKYLNLWVVTFSDDLLGVSVFPGDPRPINMHGFVCDYRVFGSNAAHLNARFNKGRTTVHELGHFLNLRHIWGDDGTGTNRDVCGSTSCSGSDFPGNTAADDTPNQCIMNYGNPDPNGIGVVKTDACTGSAPGIMYQNFMDYCDDVALVMFTKGQNARMEDAFNSSDRGPLLNSLAYNPPVIYDYDAKVAEILKPFQNEFIGCVNTIKPQVRITNFGNTALTSLQINVKLNGAVVGTPFNWASATPLVKGAFVTVTLNDLPITFGNHEIKIYTSKPNGLNDELPANDTVTHNFTVLQPTSIPLSNNFETAFLPSGFSIKNHNKDALQWVWATPGTGGTGTGSAGIDNYNNDAEGTFDDYLSPIINRTTLGSIDSVFLTFDLAYKYYSESGVNVSDELEILATNDCGNTYTSIYKGSGNNIANGSTASLFVPNVSDWRKRTFAVGQNIFGSNNFQFVIRNINNYGNAMYFDNVNIFSKYNRDLSVVKATPGVVCSQSYTPSLTVRNNGASTISSYKVAYTINNGSPIITTITGINLLKDTETTTTLTAGTLANGTNTIKIYTYDPVDRNNITGDQIPVNDTLSYTVYIAATVNNDSITESFSNTVFPAGGWGVENPDRSLTWQRSPTGKNGTDGSALINSYDYTNANNSVDRLFMPVLNYGMVDSLLLTFDLAAQLRVPSTTFDTLEVLITKDCGTTFTSVYKKWGADLQTLGTGNNGSQTKFEPVGESLWRNEYINLSAYAQTPGNIQVVFKSTSNNNNNIYIDNVNLRTRVLPELLKQNGYVISPNPFTNNFNVWFLQTPTNLHQIAVYNSSGQMVWSQSYRNNTNSIIPIDLRGRASGMYFIKITYGDKEILSKIIKTN